jgi:hypothetical protein
VDLEGEVYWGRENLGEKNGGERRRREEGIKEGKGQFSLIHACKGKMDR